MQLQDYVQARAGIVGYLTDLAKVAVALQQVERAGILFGKAVQLRDSIGETQSKALPAEQAEYAQYREKLNRTLGESKFRQTWQAGALLGLEKVLKIVLAIKDQQTTTELDRRH